MRAYLRFQSGKMKSQSFIPLIMALAVLYVGGGFYYYVFHSAQTPPTTSSSYGIVEAYPSPNSVNVSVRTEVWVTFSKEPPIVKLNLDPWVRAVLYGVESAGETGRKFIFALAEPLQLGTTYTAIVTYGETDSLQTFTWSFTTASACPSPEATPPWHLMPVTVLMWENGEWKLIADYESPIIVFLEDTIRKLNLQVEFPADREKVQEIIKHGKVLEMTYRLPKSFSISQWIEPKDRDHYKTDEKGYRTLEEVETVLFILENNLSKELEAHILVYSHVDWNWSCWAIKKEANEIDKSWIKELSEILGT